MEDNKRVVVDAKRRKCSCGQFVLLFGDLFVIGYVQWHCNGDWVFQ